MLKASRFVLLLSLACCGFNLPVQAADTPVSTAPTADLPLFAVQVRTGDKWDASKPPQEQALFREHSANLKRLRDAGHLVMGARFSDVGLIVLAAESEAQARAMMDADPSIAAGTFRYEVHPFNVFYPGTVRSPARPKPQ
jgi:uncharacterized protein YciI